MNLNSCNKSAGNQAHFKANEHFAVKLSFREISQIGVEVFVECCTSVYAFITDNFVLLLSKMHK